MKKQDWLGLIISIVLTTLLIGAVTTAAPKPAQHVSILINGLEVLNFACEKNAQHCIYDHAGDLESLRSRLIDGDVLTVIVGDGSLSVTSSIAWPEEKN